MKGKKQIRRVIILTTLIMWDNHEMFPKIGRHKEFTRPIPSKEIIHIYRVLFREDKVTDQYLYKIIKELNNEGLIIVVDPKEHDISKYTPHTKKQGPTPIFYTLKKSPEHFLRLTKEIDNFNKINLNGYKKDYAIVIASYIKSDYAHNIINKDLVNIIGEDLGLSFSEIEKETILRGIKTSIYSFWKVFEYYQAIKNEIEKKPATLREIEDRIKSKEMKGTKKGVFAEKLIKKVIEKNLTNENIKKTLINKLQLGIGEYIEDNETTLTNEKIINDVEKEVGGKTTDLNPTINDFTITYDVKIKLEPTKKDIKPEEYNIFYIDKKGEINIKSRLVKDYTKGIYLQDSPWKYR